MFKNNCGKQCRQVTFKSTMTKLPVQKQTHRTAQNTQNNNTLQTFRISYFVFGFFYFTFYFRFLHMNSPRNVELPPWYGQRPIVGLNQF